jgi:hypothetical protein
MLKPKFEEWKNEFATKDDLYNLRTELKEDIKNVEVKLEVRIAKAHADLIKWMFIFWIGQLASFIAIAKFLFHQ